MPARHLRRPGSAKEEARSLGRYLLEDFGQAMVKRMSRGERMLLIVDEFSALARCMSC